MMSVGIKPVQFTGLVVLVCEDKAMANCPDPSFVYQARRQVMSELDILQRIDPNAALMLDTLRKQPENLRLDDVWACTRTSWYFVSRVHGIPSKDVPPAHSIHLCKATDGPQNIASTISDIFVLYHKLVVQSHMHSSKMPADATLQETLTDACSSLGETPVLPEAAALAEYMKRNKADQQKWNVHECPGFDNMFGYVLSTMHHKPPPPKPADTNTQPEKVLREDCKCYETIGPCSALNDIQHMQLDECEMQCRQLRKLRDNPRLKYDQESVIWANKLIDEPMTMMQRTPPRMWVEEQSRHLRASMIVLQRIMNTGQGNAYSLRLIKEVKTRIVFDKVFTRPDAPSRVEWLKSKAGLQSTSCTASLPTTLGPGPFVGPSAGPATHIAPVATPLTSLTSVVPSHRAALMAAASLATSVSRRSNVTALSSTSPIDLTSTDTDMAPAPSGLPPQCAAALESYIASCAPVSAPSTPAPWPPRPKLADSSEPVSASTASPSTPTRSNATSAASMDNSPDKSVTKSSPASRHPSIHNLTGPPSPNMAPLHKRKASSEIDPLPAPAVRSSLPAAASAVQLSMPPPLMAPPLTAPAVRPAMPWPF